MKSEESAQNGSAGITPMSSGDFMRLSRFIHQECGIRITDAKKTMIEARLQRRLKKLGLKTYVDYCDYLFSPKGLEEELAFMIDEVTTNKTDFFREPAHFRFLTDRALPELMKKYGSVAGKSLNIWSAGCSSGEEPYTLAMVLKEFGERLRQSEFRFLILATDVSGAVLNKAEMAVYEEERVEPVPSEYRRKYFLRSKDASRGVVRVVPELRKHVKFRRLNFMDDDFGFKESQDIIFCRNVIIYFDRPTQERLLNRFCRSLSKGGYIFMGHSETLFGMDLPLVPVVPTVYKRV